MNIYSSPTAPTFDCLVEKCSCCESDFCDNYWMAYPLRFYYIISSLSHFQILWKFVENDSAVVVFSWKFCFTQEKNRMFVKCGNMSSLRRHELFHTNPHYCGVCGKRWVTLNLLTRHKIVHSKKKNQQCKWCGHRYRCKHFRKTYWLRKYPINGQMQNLP